MGFSVVHSHLNVYPGRCGIGRMVIEEMLKE
jgi:hypothetical protein